MKDIVVKTLQGKKTVDTLHLKEGKTVTIDSHKGYAYELLNTTTEAAPEGITIQREGRDLIVFLEEKNVNHTEPDLVFKEYYTADETPKAQNTLIGMGQDGKYYPYVLDTDTYAVLNEGVQAHQVLGTEEYSLAAISPWWGLTALIPAAFLPLLALVKNKDIPSPTTMKTDGDSTGDESAHDDKEPMVINGSDELDGTVVIPKDVNHVVIDQVAKDTDIIFEGDDDKVLKIEGIDSNASVTFGDGNDQANVTENIDHGGKLNLGGGDDTAHVGGSVQNGSEINGEEGNDTITIDKNLDKKAKVDLGDGDNKLTVGKDIKGESTVIGGKDNDSVDVGGSLKGKSKVDLGDGNNNTTIGDDMTVGSSVTGGKGDDTVDIGDKMKLLTKVVLGDGNNKVTVANDMILGSSIISGKGDDQITIGSDMRINTKVDAGDGNNTVNVGKDMKLGASISTGAGEDTVVVEGVMTVSTHIDSGSGDDTVRISHFNGKLDLGEGDDMVYLGNPEDHPHPVVTGIATGTIDGGEGHDVLHITPELTKILDFSTLTGGITVKGIEEINLENDVAQTLTLRANHFKDYTEGDIVYVKGDEADSVSLKGFEKQDGEVIHQDGYDYQVYHAPSGFSLYVETELL